MKFVRITILITGLVFCGNASGQMAINHSSMIDIGGILKLDMKSVDIIMSDRALLKTETSIRSNQISESNMIIPENSTKIIRLDKGIFWQINDNEKTFIEQSLGSLKNASDPLGAIPQDKRAENYKWDIQVKKINKPGKINGFSCSGNLATAVGINKHEIADTIIIRYEQWKSSGIGGQTELTIFFEEFAAKAGPEQVWGQQGVDLMLKRYGTQFEALTAEMAKNTGFPIKTIIEIESTPARDLSEEGLKDKGGKDVKGKKPKRQTTLKIIDEVTKIGKSPVNEGNFEIPAGYSPK